MPVVPEYKSRKKRVATASAVLASIGLALWLGVSFLEADSGLGLRLLLASAQLWWVFVGVAAVGWIIHEALPDD
jgi:hypothetical protein